MDKKGFSLIELLVALLIIGVLIALALPASRGMRQEAQKNRTQSDLKVIKLAIESFYRTYNRYPEPSAYQTTLLNASPRIFEERLYDPFTHQPKTEYRYKLGSGAVGPADARYYIIYSVGFNGSDEGCEVDNRTGVVTIKGDDIWISNGSVASPATVASPASP